MDTPQASTSAIPYDATITPAMEEDSAATSEEEESEVEAAVISRGRRSNAGSRMRALLEQEENVEAEELFAEEADDQDFAVLKDENDIFDSDFGETSSESEGEEGKEADPEKQLRRAEKAARREARANRTNIKKKLHKPFASRKSKPTTDESRKRSRYSPGGTFMARTFAERSSTRTAAVQFNKEVDERAVEDAARKKEYLEKLLKKREGKKAKVEKEWTQTELIEEALATEELNKASLRAFYEAEEMRREFGEHGLQGTGGYQIYGPRLCWVSTTMGGERAKKRKLVQEAEGANAVLQVRASKSIPTEKVAAPRATSTNEAIDPSLQTPSDPAISPTEPSVLEQPEEELEPCYLKTLITLEDLDQLDDGGQKPYARKMTSLFGDHVDWANLKIIPAKGRPLTRRPIYCPMTGLPARYKDPKTNVPYANTAAYKTLQLVQRQSEYEGFVWSADFGAFVGPAPVDPNPALIPEENVEEVVEEEEEEEEEPIPSRGTMRPRWHPALGSSIPAKRGRPPASKASEGKKLGPKKGGKKVSMSPEPVVQATPNPRGPPKQRGAVPGPKKGPRASTSAADESMLGDESMVGDESMMSVDVEM